ncbi:MAG: bifunctional folylpolyglutamate synthase/dihydrofolate synthase [Bacteroidota bacterium]
MNYQAAVQYIHDCSKFGIKLGLERIREILKRAGDPQDKYRIVHIAGTNGKGSTAAFYDFALREAGLKVGRFTSPHLSSYRERITVNGEPISEADLAEVITELKSVVEEVATDGFGPPTEFELGTAAGLLYFARREVDLAVVEVGMGGRFDATNVVIPILSVITHIALDHREYLGDTLEKIAFEKAGIIKPGVPVVIGIQEPEIEKYLTEVAISRKAPYSLAGSLNIERAIVNERGNSFDINHPLFGGLTVRTGLVGKHQINNCLNFLAGLEFLSQLNLELSQENIITGLAKAHWPGRFERVPGFERFKLYLDGAHNPDGMRALAGTLTSIYPGQKADLLVGILGNRPLAEMAAILAPVARRVIITTVPDPKSSKTEDLTKVFAELGIEIVAEPVPEKALELLLATDNRLAIICGSLYLVGYLRDLLVRS